jgi:hypothetical protein
MERGDASADAGPAENAGSEAATISDAQANALESEIPREREHPVPVDERLDVPPRGWQVAAEERTVRRRVNDGIDVAAVPGGDKPEAADASGNPEATDAGRDSQESGRHNSTADAQGDRVLKRLDVLEDELDDLRADLVRRARRQRDQDDLIDELGTVFEIRQEVRELRERVVELAAGGVGQDPALPTAVAAQQAALVSDVRDARRCFGENVAWQRIWRVLKKVAPHLWALITRVARIKEWSVTGQLGTGVLGLPPRASRSHSDSGEPDRLPARGPAPAPVLPPSCLSGATFREPPICSVAPFCNLA